VHPVYKLKASKDQNIPVGILINSPYSPHFFWTLRRMSRLTAALTNRFVRTCQATISRHHVLADTFWPSNSLQQKTLTRSFAAKVSALSLNAKKRKGKKITMVTAYDYPSAVVSSTE
jgi:hypothetical protein